MTRWTLGFLIAVIGITHLSFLPSLQVVGFLVVISSFVLIFFRRRIVFLFPFLIVFLVGLLWVLIVAQHRMQHYLPSALEGKTLLATGTIVSIPEYHAHQLRFDFLIKEIATKRPIHYPLRVRLSGYRYSHSYHPPQLKKGEVWQFAIRLKRPRAFWNPGSFDYQAPLFQQDIQATGYILDRFYPRLIQPARFYYGIDHLREKLTRNIKTALNDYPLLGLISALTTGVRYEITDAQWKVMRGTGTNNLFAISGLHLAFIAGIIYFITRFVYCRIPYATLFMPASQVAAGLTGIFAVFYSVLAGFALPLQRALLMLLVFLAANLAKRNLPSAYAFNSALLIILVCSPFSILSASFWLSFVAVAFIFYAAFGRIKSTTGWRSWARTQYSVGLGLIPLSALFFQQIAWLSFIANAIAIPSVGFIILPMALIGVFSTLLIPSWGNGLLILAERLLELLWQLLTYLSTLEWRNILLL
ncbi:ComEC/Rec2 family competence protein [Rickettsiella endosymbiont of Dermanyssus gallinae]|uniref:ComEC/Rec2 family competence protein n=1 Tax=Rickettsiella endosymbiont of Dermanyssus gallinae TaxID=2856608 RepID=UPI001C5342C8|nr:ComEC/Rec2 family competence protein [Rickettsiella endosymbiont of Dermanyssus gallinae]